MYFLRSLFVLILFCFITGNIQAQLMSLKSDVKVGRMPVNISFDQKNLSYIIFCGGYDANYNGVKDDGDENPSLWKISLSEVKSVNSFLYAEKLQDFEFNYIIVPLRPLLVQGTSTKPSKYYLNYFGRVRSINLDDGSILDDTVANMNVNSISYANDSLLVFSMRYYSGVDTLLLFNTNTKKVLFKYPAGENVQMTQYYSTSDGGQGLVALNEGNFGSSGSNLMFYNQLGVSDTIKLGNTGNHFDISGDVLVAAVNGDHKIVVVDLLTKTITKEIPVGTELYNGPREVRIMDNGKEPKLAMVSTYNSDVRVFNISTGECVSTLTTRGKVEGIFYDENSFLLVSNAFDNITYAPDSIVSVYAKTSGVEDNIKENANICIFPNLISNTGKLILNNSNNFSKLNVEIVNSLGMVCYSKENELIGNYFEMEINPNSMNLTDSKYFAKVQINNEIYFVPFIVVK